MQQWQRQCAQGLQLLALYPQREDDEGLPYVALVEKLVHLELSEMRAISSDAGEGEKCEGCGRVHREWFEVKIPRNGRMDRRYEEGLRLVQSVVGRWVQYAYSLDKEA
jgi:hypothetical protein